MFYKNHFRTNNFEFLLVLLNIIFVID